MKFFLQYHIVFVSFKFKIFNYFFLQICTGYGKNNRNTLYEYMNVRCFHYSVNYLYIIIISILCIGNIYYRDRSFLDIDNIYYKCKYSIFINTNIKSDNNSVNNILYQSE